MEIIIAKNSGLCYGVKRALEMAANTRRRRSGKVMTWGELIHNPQVIADLESRNIHSTEDVASLTAGTIIIRSHGVAPQVFRSLKKKEIEIIDATCPIVKKIQKLVARLAKKNAEVVIVGNRQHPETRGLVGYGDTKTRIVEDEVQARALPHRKRRAVLAQSTQDLLLFGKVVAALLEKTAELEVYNTICRSTRIRQKSTADLASRVDVLFIVGGKNSSNTRRLYENSKRILKNTHFIENAGQIPPRLLKDATKIGISGGASTPPEAIAEAVAKIRNSFEHQSQRENVVQWQS
jgi:4-hydroxy-3-methylbut-2-enyl diphosphate reductase